MVEPQSPKKTETLEVRLTLELKKALMARCLADGRTASDVLRGCAETYAAGGAAARRWRTQRLPLIGISAAMGAVILALAATNGVAADRRPAFDLLDANDDGMITRTEFDAANARAPAIMGAAATAAVAVSATPSAPNDTAPYAPGIRVSTTQQTATAMKLVTVEDDMMRTLLMQEFDRLDSDRNGKVAFDEFAAAREASVRASFASMDKDENGWLSPSEISGAETDAQGNLHPLSPSVFIASRDGNKDGRLSYDEFAKAD